MYADTFADGLTQWIKGDDSPEAESASVLLAEILLLHRAHLRSQMREQG